MRGLASPLAPGKLQPMGALLIILVVAVVIALVVVGILHEKKRREAMAAVAARLGLAFDPGKDHELARRYKFLDRLCQGSNRYMFNIISGRYDGEDVLAFDFHYETHSTDSKGNRQTHHHQFSFYILVLPLSFPELTVVREGIFSKIAQAVGYDDIDFESHEFSRKYCVRSRNKKFAYDICNARMIEYLLDNGDLTMEIEDRALGIGFDSRLDPSKIEFNLSRLVRVRRLIPDYVFEGRAL